MNIGLKEEKMLICKSGDLFLARRSGLQTPHIIIMASIPLKEMR